MGPKNWQKMPQVSRLRCQKLNSLETPPRVVRPRKSKSGSAAVKYTKVSSLWLFLTIPPQLFPVQKKSAERRGELSYARADEIPSNAEI